MTQETLMNELLSKLPAEIAEKIKAETITEEELKQYVQPLAEQYKDKVEDEMAPLSDEQLEEVSGGIIKPNFVRCWIAYLWYKEHHPLKKRCKEAGY